MPRGRKYKLHIQCALIFAKYAEALVVLLTRARVKLHARNARVIHGTAVKCHSGECTLYKPYAFRIRATKYTSFLRCATDNRFLRAFR